MKNTTAVGLLAHVDAGKTTLSEQLLYRAGALREAGRVDRRDTLLDCAPIERRRGVTVFSDQAPFSAFGRPFVLVDTPGHTDFSGEMERALSVLDCAVLVVSAAEGVQAHTETLWRLLRERGTPTFIFLNKTDRAGADPEKAFRQMEKLGGKGFVRFTGALSEEGVFSPSLQEALAELDDALLEDFLEGKGDPSRWRQRAESLIKGGRLFPVFSGSALQGGGVEELLRGLSLLAPAPDGDPDAPVSARVYKVRHDKTGRVVFLKVEQGTLRPRQVLQTPEGEEKCGEIRGYSGTKYHSLQEAGPGSLCGVTGLLSPKAGDRVGADAGREEAFSLRPLLSSRVLFDEEEVPAPVMLSRFRELEDEEPLLSVSWNSQAGELWVRVMGEIQLEVLTETVRERWGNAVSFAPCSVLYRETLAAPVVGVGHFEPLRHYAEVHLLLSPGPRGSGVTFRSQCPTDDLAQSWQNLIRTHVLEREHKGVLTGAPLTDVEVTLLSGRAHLKHTEGGDFREAVYRAVRQGLMSGKSVLLEPWYELEAECAPGLLGKLQTDLVQMEAECGAVWQDGETMRLHARGPVRTLMGYPKVFAAFTKGRGRISLRFGGWEPCRKQEEIVEAAGYLPERDVENTGDSVFCSHGAGFPVKWDEAPAHMHLPLESVRT